MARDEAELRALTDLCGTSIRFADLVEVAFLSRSKVLYLAVGSQSLFFVRRDWSRVLTGGELLFTAISRVAADEAHALQVFLFIDVEEAKKGRGAVWLPLAAAAEPLCIRSIDRELLLRWLEVAWVSDALLRTGRILPFPRYKPIKVEKKEEETPLQEDLLKASCPIDLLPFHGTQKMEMEGYFFFLSRGYQERCVGQQSGAFLDGRGVEVQIVVSPAISVLHLEDIGKENISSVASVWKKALLESAFHSQLLRSQPYTKKMNLSDDPASWTAWQLWLKTTTHNIICMLLRRHYMPPLMDMSQDFTIVFKISFEDQKDAKLNDIAFLREAQATADTFSPISQTTAWKRDLLQAKLDALIYQPQHYRWFKQHLKIHPKWLPQAKVILKSILLLLYRDGVLADTELLEAIGSGVQTVEEPMDVIHNIVRSAEGLPASDIEKTLQKVKEDLAAASLREEQQRRQEEMVRAVAAAAAQTAAATGTQQQQQQQGGAAGQRAAAAATGPGPAAAAEKENGEEEEQAVIETGMDIAAIQAFHRWRMRVGRYIAYCIDGGILGYRFSLADVNEAVSVVSPPTRAKLLDILAFLLHLRPKNWLLSWTPESLRNAKTMLRKTNYTFNDQVFIPLLECGFLAKLFAKGEEVMYLELLRRVLEETSSHALKLALCKQILKGSAERPEGEHFVQQQKQRAALLETLVPSLVNLLHNKSSGTLGSSVTLQNICLGALINLTAGDARVKEMLLQGNIYEALDFIFQMKEETLQLPCTQLCINLTKTAQHRQALISTGAVNRLVDILMSQYTSVFYGKQKLLGAVAAVLGQLASEPNICKELNTRYPVLDCLLYLFHVAHNGDLEFRSRILFCIKQLCHGDWQVQQRVGKHCIRTLVNDLRENALHADYCTGVLLLFQVLADFKPNCFDMKAADIQDALEYVLEHTKLDTLYTRIANLQERVIRQTRVDYFSV